MTQASGSEATVAASPEHARLDPLAGTFEAEITMSSGSGEAFVARGTIVNSWDLGGRFLKQVYRGDPPGFEGRGYWGFNELTGNYETFWADTASSMMQVDTGTVDQTGKVWTMEGRFTHPQTGDPMVKRSVVTLLDADTHRIDVYFIAAGQEQTRAMRMLYRRVEA